MRTPIVAANWKMNKTPDECRIFNEHLQKYLEQSGDLQSQIIVFPPFTSLEEQANFSRSFDALSAGAQDCHFEDEGAFTGEVSPKMIKSAGCEYVILGHSERRDFFHEDNGLLSDKATAAFRNKLVPVYCCGETEYEREKGLQEDVVSEQLREGLPEIPDNPAEIIIAYEPVWAIGTGHSANSEQIREMHETIRKELAGLKSAEWAEQVSILYGGSIKTANAKEIFSLPDVDGGLIGGASLNAEDFTALINSMEEVCAKKLQN